MEYNSGFEGKVECPKCGDFVGEPGSVRNHITAKTDDLHDGEDGADYLGELEQKARGENTELESGEDDNPFAENDDTEIKQAKKVETPDGEKGYSFVIVGTLGILLWLWTKGDLDMGGENNPAPALAYPEDHRVS